MEKTETYGVVKAIETMGLYVSEYDEELSVYTHKVVNKKLFDELCYLAKKYGYGFTLMEVVDDNVLTLRFAKNTN